MSAPPRAPESPLALGIDAGGTETRWALAGPGGEFVAEGAVGGFSAVEAQGPGQARVAQLLAALAQAVLAWGRPVRVHAGLTGLGAAGQGLTRLIAEPLGLPIEAVTLGSDIETAYLDLFAPGEGYLVYAGTGSVAAFLDADGNLHRAGGRGVIIDDGGGGFWIAREALRQVWRAEDERPGSGAESPLAQELFALVGGADWDHTRQAVYGGTRGDIGRLALAVAKAADRDPAAQAILAAAGRELARLAGALLDRYGPRPVALSGRAASLHPLIAATLAEGLPPGITMAVRTGHGEHAAARIALAAAAKPLPSIQDPQP